MHASIRTARVRPARVAVAAAVVALAMGVAAPAFAKSTKSTKATKTYTAKTINVKGTEYKFLGVPATISSGPHTFTFSNVGKEAHMMIVVKLKPGKTLDDAIAFQGDGTDPAAPFVDIATVSLDTPGDGTVGSFTSSLTAGDYAMACFVTDPEGKPHIEDGMLKSFKVVK